MLIRDMFIDDINREIGGVVQVGQDDAKVIKQEVEEYVVTQELKKHMMTFFNAYVDAMETGTSSVGVWISGFFGSGKSHFLKMLSYIMENRQIGDTTTVEIFREKFLQDNDLGSFMVIDKATRPRTETILFNIDVESPLPKDLTAVIRVFAKVFYQHRGFYGENLKVALLERYIEEEGKTEEFRRVFEEKKGKSWLEQRRVFSFNAQSVIPTLVEVLGMGEEDARAWFTSKSEENYSIAQFVQDVKDYVDAQPDDYRLLFMADEVGQYTAGSIDMLMNLQSITESLGKACNGKVWVCCTGQEALDEIMDTQTDAFSRIQARFKTRLSLSSSSVDEVIQKRILRKTPEATVALEELFDQKSSDLRNLYTFKDARADMKGYEGPAQFATNYPFVPYQFTIMQNVFTEIRKHGHTGKHLSGGERSMLSGFQESAIKLQDSDETALAPFFHFYDTVQSFLDGSIRRVIERAARAAEQHQGLESYDVEVLKLLYLTRYVDDIPSNMENIQIMMADAIDINRLQLHDKVQASLDRLVRQNYVSRSGDMYKFLTDEEQDIQRDINNANVDNSAIVSQLGNIIFNDIYMGKKFTYEKYNFSYDQMIDNINIGSVGGGICLRFMTVAAEDEEKTDLQLQIDSKGKVIVVLGESNYYTNLQRALKIRKYVNGKNVSSLSATVKNIIHIRQEEATAYEKEVKDELEKAIMHGTFYADGERIRPKGSSPKALIDQAMEYVVLHVYSKLDLIGEHFESDSDILGLLTGRITYLEGANPNQSAMADMEEYLLIQDRKNLPTNMADIHSRYQAIPYGWREVDIAAVAALLVYNQKATIRYGGEIIKANNTSLPTKLRSKVERGRTGIEVRKSINAGKIKDVKDFMREYFNAMDIPVDEDGLIAEVITRFEAVAEHYDELLTHYDGRRQYPGKDLLLAGNKLVKDVLLTQKDNVALVNAVVANQVALLDSKEDLGDVETFFKNQVQIFDQACDLEEELRVDNDQLETKPEAYSAMNRIRLLVKVQGASFTYSSIPELNGLMQTVRAGHGELLASKRNELNEIIRSCMEELHTAGNGDARVKEITDKADAFYSAKRAEIENGKTINNLDGLMVSLWNYKNQALAQVAAVLAPPVRPAEPTGQGVGPVPEKKKKSNRKLYCQMIFPPKVLESEADIDAYLAQRKEQLLKLLEGYDGVEIQ